MIGIKQKGIEGVKVMTPDLKNINFEKLPRYISYKSALLKQKIALEYFLIAVVIILGSAYLSERSNNASLVAKLREKEYIVLPDFITVSPQSVSEEVINLAISDFISHLGNVNALDIEDNFIHIKKMMTPELRKEFDLQSAEVIEKFKTENITEKLSCPKKELLSANGVYQVTAFCKKETYANYEFIGSQEEVIQIKLKLIPPNKVKRWVLEATDLSRSTMQAYLLTKQK